MNHSKAKIISQTILGKISSILGYIITIFFGLLTIITLVDDIPDEDGLVKILFVIVAIGIFLIRLGIKMKKKIQRFRKYDELIGTGQISSIEELANCTMKSSDFVRKDLQKLMNQNFFTNVQFDGQNRVTMGNNSINISSFNMNSNGMDSVNIEINLEEDSGADTDAVTEEVSSTVACQNCGAMNERNLQGVTYCEYCNSAIK